MNEPIQKRPQVGDWVQVGDLPELFKVIDRDGGLYVLESKHGARCRAGVLVVRLVDEQKKEAA
ncbi:hypothetical protein [Sediminicurvatus halobius]|uniref:Uncharacterized protein n=1 Tax=Sediminicurvatus halobius TaxID=2182432 RepID=A0A2U2N0N2_9GAMM|nr:hypothetical protein [Spiribacter halobius]PWG62524.1 hypothetical protein DEM34_12145 [Spiribacter halobius]UEX78623.1 hypothetical protein LMH63_02970 [Spiribacter halobius]